ncbi:MAG: trans-aconitate 2-methyltransferase [Desulfovibrionaceae bacterium]
MQEQDRERLIQSRRARIAEFGSTEAGVDWSHKHPGRQLLHFEILRRIEGFEPTDGIFDVGCGFGDLAEYLRRSGWTGRYAGMDLSPDTVQAARAKHPDLDIRLGALLDQSMAERFDWVFCSGTLNYRLEGMDNYVYLERMLRTMFEMSVKGVALNLLSPLVDFELDISFHPRFDRLLAMVAGLTHRFTLRHDFAPYEFALYLYRDDRIERDGNVFASAHPLLERLRGLL